MSSPSGQRCLIGLNAEAKLAGAAHWFAAARANGAPDSVPYKNELAKPVNASVFNLLKLDSNQAYTMMQHNGTGGFN